MISWWSSSNQTYPRVLSQFQNAPMVVALIPMYSGICLYSIWILAEMLPALPDTLEFHSSGPVQSKIVTGTPSCTWRPLYWTSRLQDWTILGLEYNNSICHGWGLWVRNTVLSGVTERNWCEDQVEIMGDATIVWEWPVVVTGWFAMLRKWSGVLQHLAC